MGYSDHSLGTVIAPAAVAMGARVIEKHITLDKTLEGPDHRASLDPYEFKDMVEEIRLIERSLGNGQKVPHRCELENRSIARKSLVATRQIKQGSEIKTGDVAAKRATRGRSPMEYWGLIGTRAKKDFEYDDPL